MEATRLIRVESGKEQQKSKRTVKWRGLFYRKMWGSAFTRLLRERGMCMCIHIYIYISIYRSIYMYINYAGLYIYIYGLV